MRPLTRLALPIRGAALAALLSAAGTTSAAAQRLDQGACIVTPLGQNSSAVTYWIDVPQGFLVVTTIDTVKAEEASDEEHHAIVRISMVLRPGQTQTVQIFFSPEAPIKTTDKQPPFDLPSPAYVTSKAAITHCRTRPVSGSGGTEHIELRTISWNATMPSGAR